MSQDSLKEAADLIKTGKRAEARLTLTNVLKADLDNAGAWWLFAHAAPSTDMARRALEEVQRLHPDNPRVLQALARLGVEETSSTTLAELLSDAAARLMADEPMPQIDYSTDEMDMWLDIEEKRKRGDLPENNMADANAASTPRVLLSVAFAFAILIFIAMLCKTIVDAVMPMP